MKAFVITITDLPESVEIAQRCIRSAKRYGVEVEMFDAFTPDDGPAGEMQKRGFNAQKFTGNKYSRILPCLSCFLSHSALWQMCLDEDEAYLILEHDAVFTAKLPDLPDEHGLINLGKPSYGNRNTPPAGLGKLVSKPYLPGAHAYMLWPGAAKAILREARMNAEPTDIFLNLNSFPFIKEFYPWPVEVDDSFSTIQRELGCRAKHNPVTPI